MSETTEEQVLIPVPVPPLANLLADAERRAGRRLTEDQVVAIRDAAICIVLPREQAAHMELRRGFRDVSLDNCWSDWQRLRVQLTGQGMLPRIVLCVLGDETFPARAAEAVPKAGIELEAGPADPRMLGAFRAAASPWEKPLSPLEIAGIAGHRSVVYLVGPAMTAADAPVVALDFLASAAKLFEAGAVAIKSESSGLAHSRQRWLELAAAATGASDTDPEAQYRRWSALFSAHVQYPIAADDSYYTCGMHLLGHPDLIVETAAAERLWGAKGMARSAELLESLALFLLAECPPGTFGHGHRFSTGNGEPSFLVLWEECTSYEEDDFFFNPFGFWRLQPLDPTPAPRPPSVRTTLRRRMRGAP
jgi:hypothetical protein